MWIDPAYVLKLARPDWEAWRSVAPIQTELLAAADDGGYWAATDWLDARRVA